MTSPPIRTQATYPRHHQADRSSITNDQPIASSGRRLALALAGATAIGSSVILAPAVADASVIHSGCTSVAAGESSGWCDLYSGNATANVQEQGQVTVSANGMSLMAQTQDTTTGAVPATSFACLVIADPSQITHRLQQTQCSHAGGVAFSASGGTITIDLSQYPQFLNTQFTVQVAASRSAKNANGDSSYNNVSVNTVNAPASFT